MTSTYTPTAMEKLFGKHYKWWFFIVYNFKAQRAYFADTIMWTAYNIISLLGGFFIWWITTKDNQNFDTSEILTYLFIGNLINSFINNWAEMDLGWMNKSGEITPKLLVPTSFLKMMYVKFIGRGMLANFSISIFGFLLCFPLLKDYFLLPSSLTHVLLTFLMLPIAYSISFLANFTFGCVTFWMVETEGANTFYNYFARLLSGNFIPLLLLANYIPFLDLQFFAWLLHHPMQIYLGNYTTNQTLLTFAGGIIWSVVLYFLAKFVFKMGLKRNESVGL